MRPSKSRCWAGDDIYLLDDAGDDRTEAVSEGIDEIRSSNAVQYLAANIENLTGLSSAGQRRAGNGLDNVITGHAGDDVITGDDGNDTLNGGAGVDRLYGDAGNDTFVGGLGGDIYYGGLGDDVFRFNTVDFETGVVDIIADFHSAPGDADTLSLQGAAAGSAMVQVGTTSSSFTSAGARFRSVTPPQRPWLPTLTTSCDESIWPACDAGRYRPLKTGLRFSLNALMPSWRSSVPTVRL